MRAGPGVDGLLIGLLHLHIAPVGGVGPLDESGAGVAALVPDELQGSLQTGQDRCAEDGLAQPSWPDQVGDLGGDVDGARLLVRLRGVLVGPAVGGQPVLQLAVGLLDGQVLEQAAAEIGKRIEESRCGDDGCSVAQPDLRVGSPGGEAANEAGSTAEGGLVVVQRGAGEEEEAFDLGTVALDTGVGAGREDGVRGGRRALDGGQDAR